MQEMKMLELHNSLLQLSSRYTSRKQVSKIQIDILFLIKKNLQK